MSPRRRVREDDACHERAIHPEALARVQRDMPASETMQALAETFKALSDPSRTRILFALSRAELCVCDLAELLDLSVSAVSHQLRHLRELKLVKYRREGKMAYYSLDDGHVKTLFKQGLAHVEEGR